MSEHRHFIPAAGHDWLLPFYDPLLRLMGASSLRRVMLERAAIQPGQRVLDIGCGTGSLVVELLKRHPGAEVTGFDPDRKALAIARKKASRAGVQPLFEEGFSDALPFEDGCFDHVFSSFMFHHLQQEEQRATLEEVRRVLKPGGSLQLVDFAGLSERTDLAGQIRASRFSKSCEVSRRRSLFGSVSHYEAVA